MSNKKIEIPRLVFCLIVSAFFVFSLCFCLKTGNFIPSVMTFYVLFLVFYVFLRNELNLFSVTILLISSIRFLYLPALYEIGEWRTNYQTYFDHTILDFSSVNFVFLLEEIGIYSGLFLGQTFSKKIHSFKFLKFDGQFRFRDHFLLFSVAFFGVVLCCFYPRLIPFVSLGSSPPNSVSFLFQIGVICLFLCVQSWAFTNPKLSFIWKLFFSLFSFGICVILVSISTETYVSRNRFVIFTVVELFYLCRFFPKQKKWFYSAFAFFVLVGLVVLTLWKRGTSTSNSDLFSTILFRLTDYCGLDSYFSGPSHIQKGLETLQTYGIGGPSLLISDIFYNFPTLASYFSTSSGTYYFNQVVFHGTTKILIFPSSISSFAYFGPWFTWVIPFLSCFSSQAFLKKTKTSDPLAIFVFSLSGFVFCMQQIISVSSVCIFWYTYIIPVSLIFLGDRFLSKVFLRPSFAEISEDKTKRKNTFSLILSLISALISFGLSFCLAYVYGTESYGTVQYYLGWVSTLSYVVIFGLPDYLVKNAQFSKDKKAFFSKAFFFSTIWGFLTLSIFGVIAFFFIGQLKKMLIPILLVCVCSYGVGISIIVMYFLLGIGEKDRSVIIGSLLPKVLLFLAFGIAFVFGQLSFLFKWYVLAYFLAFILPAVPFLFFFLKKTKNLFFSKTEFVSLLAFFGIALTANVTNQIAKILQGDLFNMSSVGSLSLALQIIAVSEIFSSNVNSLFRPEFAKFSEEKNYVGSFDLMNSVLRIDSCLLVPFCVGVGVQAAFIFSLFKSNYLPYWPMLSICAAYGCLNSLFEVFHSFFSMSGGEKLDLIDSVIGSIFYLGLAIGFSFISEYGIILGMFLGCLVKNILRYLELLRKYKKSPVSLFTLMTLIIEGAISFVVFWLLNFINNIVVLVCLDMLCGLIVVSAFLFFNPKRDFQRLFLKRRAN